MTNLPSRFRDLAARAHTRVGALALLRDLGLGGKPITIPVEAWPAYGVADAPEVAGLCVAGRAGSLDALLIELDPARPAAPERVARIAASIRRRNPVRLHLFVFLAPDRLVLGTHGPDGDFRHLTLEPHRVRDSDVDAIEEMAARDGEDGLALAVRHARALDRGRVTRRFFLDFRAHRDAIAAALVGLPADATRERGQVALLILCRLTFLCFLQRRGTLAGDDRYLPRLLARWRPRPHKSFFRARLQPLFFESLNRPVAERPEHARALGALPYLNGGLFEPHPVERASPDLDLPDDVVRRVVRDLLERYRFTAREAGAGYGVDPEILGRVFEGLMAPDKRGDTGTFYTPAPVVDRVVREAIAVYVAGKHPDLGPDVVAGIPDGSLVPPDLTGHGREAVGRTLERIRILDPACGSGAFLLGALDRLAAARSAVTGAPTADARRDVVARSLHGVDLLDDAALLCALRLWLALSEDDEVRPLPNLDRRIRQGDALIDPMDLSFADPASADPSSSPLRDPELRDAFRAVGPVARRYLASEPDGRDHARSELVAAESELARRWARRLIRRCEQDLAALRAAAGDRDLFGAVPEHARRARRELVDIEERSRELRDVARLLEDRGALPFFSFGVHFAEAGGTFDLIVSNPPWVRSHRWPEHLRRMVAHRFEVCRRPGWPDAAALAGVAAGGGAQLDLALLFLERCVRLLAPGGVLAILLPAKTLRALYGGPARRILLRDLDLLVIEDHALDQRSIFKADAFAAVLIARRPGTGAPRPEPGLAGPGDECPANPTRPRPDVTIRMIRRGVPAIEFAMRPEHLPLVTGDAASPWIVAPPEPAAVLRAMQCAGPPLGRHPDLPIRRGVMTGANPVLVMASAVPRLGGLCRVTAAGFGAARQRGAPARTRDGYRAHVETADLRPLIRGADLDAFVCKPGAYVVWCHDAQTRPREPGRRTARYLARHRDTLEARPGWRTGLPLGAIFRLSPDTVRPKVAWHDLSDTLRAAALPARVPFDGLDRELVPLNTVYFIPGDSDREARLLAGILNSMPARTFARSIAERAKDARFRFFAWTLACLPLPASWREHPAANAIRRISDAAHARGAILPAEQVQLDLAVAALYGLGSDQIDTLARFDRWLNGQT